MNANLEASIVAKDQEICKMQSEITMIQSDLDSMRKNLDEKEKQLANLREENRRLKTQVDDADVKVIYIPSIYFRYF